MLEYIATNGNTGHSFEIVVDPDLKENRKIFGWDGDGSDMIKSIETIKEPVYESVRSIHESTDMQLIDEQKLIKYSQAIEDICNGEYGQVYWNKEENKIFVCLGDSSPFDESMIKEYMHDAVKINWEVKWNDIEIIVDYECAPKQDGKWLIYKKGKFVSYGI